MNEIICTPLHDHATRIGKIGTRRAPISAARGPRPAPCGAFLAVRFLLLSPDCGMTLQ